jgi:hypothetical protein
MDGQMAEHPLRIVIRRQWPKMTQAMLARRMDINEAQMSRYLTGRREPPAHFWKAAAEILGVDENEIRPPKAEGAAA